MQQTAKKELSIALIGNPNTGKTTVFNALCGTKQKTGNYPGVTVEKRIGYLDIKDYHLEIYDLPGLYSLRATSSDEKIALEVLTGRLLENKKPDIILYIIDASNLKRNLYLLLQILELNIPVIGILTMIDIAEKKGIICDTKKLQDKLQIPIFSINAKNSKDIQNLKENLNQAINHALNYHNYDNIKKLYPKNINEYYKYCLKELNEFFKKNHINISLTPADAFLCLTDQNEFLFYLEQLLLTEKSQDKNSIQIILNDLKQTIQKIIESSKEFQIYSNSQIIQYRYKIIDTILKETVQQKEILNKKTLTETLDSILTHKFLGLILFINIMAIMFQSIYTWATPLMDLIEEFFSYLTEIVSNSGIFSPMMESFINDGIIAGVGSVVVFVPQIAILFFFIAILEDSGYLARASFLMDKLLSWTGLNGRSFIPLISSFACAVPGIMATRVINDDKVRKSTILVAPLMSCSARLPVYILFIGTFIEPKYGALIAGLCLFAMHSIGLIVAFFVSLIMNKKILKTPSIPFIMELPEYHIPSLRNIYFRVIDAVKNFLKRAGTIIFAMSIIIWGLIYFPHDEELAQKNVEPLLQQLEELKNLEQEDIKNGTPFPERKIQIELLEKEIENEIAAFHLSNSYLGRMGKTIEPIFRPLGFDWKLSIGILSAFPAREVIISTLGIIYNVGEADEESDSLRSKLLNEKFPDGSPVYTPLTAISLMVFFALCAQCMSTLAIIKKELGSWKYPIYVFLYMTGLAYLLSLIVYQTGKFFFY
ncbi:MAG: ferrous iron transport protein B [Leptospiraceae bacterium]|nr:MAG: ferrous iron transport protein B [Leptospiraceae bacterium]